MMQRHAIKINKQIQLKIIQQGSVNDKITAQILNQRLFD